MRAVYYLFSLVLLIFNALYTNDVIKSKRSIDINYVKKKYEKKLFGIDHLFYPAKKPQKLYIIFNGAVKNRYSMWSWFWNSKEQWEKTSFLFLKDDTTSWYIGTQEKPLTETYTKLIRHYLDEYNIHPNKVFTMGSSMGGYASLLYGILFEVGAVFAFRPQIDYENAAKFFLVKHLSDSWIDLNEFIKKCKYIPKIYLNYGDFLPDKQAAEGFIQNIQKRSKSILVVHKTDNKEHMGFVPTKNFIIKTLAYLDQINLDGTCL